MDPKLRGDLRRAGVNVDDSSWDFQNAIKVGGVAVASAEIGVIDGVTPGTVTASKAMVVDANRDLGTARNLAAETLLAGKNGVGGVAGAVTIRDGANPGASVSLNYSQLTTLVLQGFADLLHLHQVLASEGYTASVEVPAGRLASASGAATIAPSALGDSTVLGLAPDTIALAATGALLNVGDSDVVAAGGIGAGSKIKAAVAGRCIGWNKGGTTIKTTGAGAAFTNQPANDQLTVVSSNAADTTQTVTIIGTTHGGVVVVEETIALTGVVAVDSVKVDWGLILAVKISDNHAGTVTVKEKSGGATIVALATGTNSAGVETVTGASKGACGVIPTVTASGATTKVIGLKTTGVVTGAEVYQAVAANGATAQAFASAAYNVVEVYTGDLEAARTVTIKTATAQDSPDLICGMAVGTAEDFDDTVRCILK